MFNKATVFNQPLTLFNTSQVTTMAYMFTHARAFNQSLAFDTSQVTTMEDMFTHAKAFNSALDFTDTSQVTNMEGMFFDATAFNQPLTLNTSQVTNMDGIFDGTTSMTHPKPEMKVSKLENKTFSTKDGPLPSIGPPTILTAVKDKVYRYAWPELWPDFRCVITEDASITEDMSGKKKITKSMSGKSQDSVYGWLREYGDFHNETDGNGISERKVIVTSTPSEISIKLVYLGKASGICTLAVASVLYAVLDRINKKGHFPTKGKVYIESTNGCRAFNCYDRAFQINGFSLEPDQYEYVQKYAQNGNGHGEFRHTLHYYSKRQSKLKYVDQAKTALEKAKAEYHQYVKDTDSLSEEKTSVHHSHT